MVWLAQGGDSMLNITPHWPSFIMRGHPATSYDAALASSINFGLLHVQVSIKLPNFHFRPFNILAS